MRLRTLLFLSICTLIYPTFAIFASQVGLIDMHKSLLGVPITHSPQIAPRFHRIGGTAGSAAQAVFLVATERNILAALNPTEGNIVWRRPIASTDPILAFRAHSDGLITLSGPGGATVRLYEVINGNLIWENPLFDPNTGILADAERGEPSGVALEFDFVDIFVLSNGHTIRRITGATGAVSWGYSLPVQDGSTFLTSLVRTQDALYAIGLVRGIKGYQIHVISLNPKTGEVLATFDVPGNIKSAQDIVPLKAGYVSSSPLPKLGALAWIESGALKQVLLTPTLESKFLSKPLGHKYGPFSKIEELGVADRGYFLAVLQDKDSDGKGSGGKGAHIFRLEPSGLGVDKAGEFGASTSETPWTIFSGGVDRKGETYIAKFSYSATLRSASYECFVPAAVNGRGMITGFTFAFDSHLYGGIQHASIDVANPAEYVYASRIIFTTLSGTIQQWTQEEVKWGREESLASIKEGCLQVVELPVLEEDRRLKFVREGMKDRWIRQLLHLKDLPAAVFHWVQRFAIGTPAASLTSGTKMEDLPGSLWRDTYGFKKVIVIATERGKIYGIESVKGNSVWSVRLGAGADPRVKIKPLKMVTLKTVSEGLHPEVGLVIDVEQPDKNGDITRTTGIVRIDATTGATQSTMLFKGRSKAVMELDLPGGLPGSGKFVGVVDEENNMHIFPDHEEALASFAPHVENVTYPLLSHSLSGYSLVAPSTEPIITTDYGKAKSTAPPPVSVFQTAEIWKTAFSPGEKVVSVTRREKGIVANIGRVTGERRTLYKYLNPSIVAVVTESHARAGTDTFDEEPSYTAGIDRTSTPGTKCTVYFMDSNKGTVLYESNFSGKGGCDVKVSLVENWLVWHYYDGEGKVWKMVSVELYEGKENKKTRSSELSKDDPNRAEVVPIEQSYIFPYDITDITTTSTKFGISSKDIVVINSKGQIQTFSRRWLDPRRPSTKPSAAEAELGLIQYDVLLPDDPRRVLSHHYNVLSSHLLAAPTLLESTSLVIAYGGDLFISRTAPSGTFDLLGESFNKIQLVCTVIGLGVAIAISGPLVRAKKLKARWYPQQA